MAESKKFWYIQLNVNFFEDERIDWLCEQKNGYAYVVLYLKLCLKTANNNGILTRQIGDMIIPYNVDKIAEITHIDVDIVRVALELYKRIGLVYEADENCNFMRLPEVPGMVGYTTQAAIEKARQRERKKQLESGQLPDKCPDKCPDNVQDNVQQELRVKSKELRDNNLEIEIEEEDKVNAGKPATSFAYDYDFFRETYNSLCRKLPSCRTMPQKRKKAVQNFLKDFTQEQWEEICKAANESEFLTGGNDRGWKANIDFLLRPDKAVKALEGAYTRASYRDKYETDIPENQNPDSIFYGLPDDYFEGDRK